jgi:transcriptional regulator with GAF, ATPase, and Fis domain
MKNSMIVGEESGLRSVKEMVIQLSGQDIPVLITGETGTGKELVADAIQQVSTRYQEPYVKVNCGAIPDALIDSELFGHEKGAFTGADRVRYGRFEQADGGTLFLDEIGDMPMNAQVRLLRVLQDGIFERVGGSKPIPGNIRIIAATNQNLEELVRVDKFREDLFYRLNVFPIHVPPLRDRIQDIPTLANHFITKKARQLSLTYTPLIAQESLTPLQSYDWPGNVRELENLVERALALDPQGPLKLHRYLPTATNGKEETGNPTTQTTLTSVSPSGSGLSSLSLPDSVRHARESMPTLDLVVANHIREALVLCNGQISGSKGAARLLGINPNTLRKRMDKLKIPYGRQTLA